MKRNKLSLFLAMAMIICSSLSVANAADYTTIQSSAPFGEMKTSSCVGIPVDELMSLNINESLTLDDGAVLTRVTHFDYLKSVAKSEGITLSEAERVDNQNTIRADGYSNASGNSGGTYDYIYSKSFSLNGNSLFKATLESQMQMYVYGGFAQINFVRGVNTRLAGNFYVGETWNQNEADYRILYPSNGSFPAGKIEFYGNGTFQISADLALGMSWDMKAMGFQFSAGTQAYWISDTLWMTGTYQCY